MSERERGTRHMTCIRTDQWDTHGAQAQGMAKWQDEEIKDVVRKKRVMGSEK